ncbi:unnamed protein product, partial [Mesorhabditis spiculigera]
MKSMNLRFGCYETGWCGERNEFPAELQSDPSATRICYPTVLKRYILGKGMYKPWCSDPHAYPSEPQNVASWPCLIPPFCKLTEPKIHDDEKYLKPLNEQGMIAPCMDICPPNENGRGLTREPSCRAIPSNPEKDYFGVLDVTAKLDWCSEENSRLKDPWALTPPCNPIPNCRGNTSPREPEWRDNVLRYDKEVDGIACVVYKPCYDLDDEAKKLYHCSDVSTTTSTKKITTTTTAKTTPTTTKEPDTLMSDELTLVAALVGALVLIIIVVIIVLCCCLKKKKRGQQLQEARRRRYGIAHLPTRRPHQLDDVRRNSQPSS